MRHTRVETVETTETVVTSGELYTCSEGCSWCTVHSIITRNDECVIIIN